VPLGLDCCRNRKQYKIEAATSGAETQENSTGMEADNDSDDEGDLQGTYGI
jgi:hypothetical protein